MAEVRIIGGMWKGRKLRFPETAGLRPTMGRARETLFNWLQPDIHGARCLDLYAGSGALGFEALSRGALKTTFVDRSRVVTRALQKNAEMLTAQADIVTGPAQRFLNRIENEDNPEPQWDLVFLDPPFASHELERCLGALESAHYLTDDALVYFEQPRRDVSPTLFDNPLDHPFGKTWRILNFSHAGDSAFGLLARA